MAEATDAFTGDTENQHTGPQAAEDVQQATEQVQQAQQPEQTDSEAPDVSEQIQAIRDQQSQILERLPEEQQADQNDEDLYDMLYGPQDQQMAPPAGQAPPQQQQQQLTPEQAYLQALQASQYEQPQQQEDPRVAQLTEQLSTLREAVIGREEADNQRALDALATEHKDFLSQRTNAEAVRDTVYGIAGDDELLRTDPELVRTAILAAKANAAATANGDPSVSADGGAPVETAAGAAVSQGDDPNDLWAKVFEGEGTQDPFTS